MTFPSNIWAVGGGKDSVGKSFISSLLACGLALSGFKTLLIDADISDPSIHKLFGIENPNRILGDFIWGKAETLKEAYIPSQIENLSLLCGAGDLLELANPGYSQREKLLNGFSSPDAEFIIVDMGAGTNVKNLDFFNVADLGIIVTSSSPASVQNAFGFLKLAVTRKLIKMFSDTPPVLEMLKAQLVGHEKASSMSLMIEKVEGEDPEAAKTIVDALWNNSYRLVVNMASESEGENILKAITEATEQFLSLPLSHLGTVEFNKELESSVKIKCPISLKPGTAFAESIDKIVHALISYIRLTQKSFPSVQEVEEKEAEEGETASLEGSVSRIQLGLNNDIEYKGKLLHVQTEDLGEDKGRIVTHVFAGGRILFKKTTEYKELEDSGDLGQAIKEKVKWQHKVILAGISGGKLEDKIKI
jgi:flagellar biosynthesis protein FlhG